MANALKIDLISEIDGWGYTFKSVRDQVKKFKGEKIKVPLNSSGGSVLDGLAIYNTLSGHPADVEVNILTYAASMGTVIAMAGDRVTMPENGFFMVHNPTAMTIGKSEDLKRASDLLSDMKGSLVSIYAKRTGIDKEVISEMMDNETWLTAEEALDFGFVDALVEGAEFQACADIEGFKNVPKELIALASGITNKNTKMDLTKILGSVTSLFVANKDEKIEDITPEQAVENFMAHVAGPIKQITEEAVNSAVSSLQERLENIEAKAVDSDVSEEISEIRGSLDELKANHKETSDIVAKMSGKKVKGGGSSITTGLETGGNFVPVDIEEDKLREILSKA